MLGSLEKLVAVLGTPLAVIYAVGHLAQVVNLWLVETAHEFSFVTAWHVVSILDRAVVIGLGLKYLVWTLPVAALILWLLPRLLQSFPDLVSRYAILRGLRRGVSSDADDGDQKTWLEWWMWSVFGSLVVSLLIVFIWLPVQAFLSPEDDPVLTYLPHVNIAVVTASADVGSEEQALVGLSETPYDATQNRRADAPTAVEGVLLSHDEQYWYVFSEHGPSKGRIVIVPVTRTSEIQVTR